MLGIGEGAVSLIFIYFLKPGMRGPLRGEFFKWLLMKTNALKPQ